MVDDFFFERFVLNGMTNKFQLLFIRARRGASILSVFAINVTRTVVYFRFLCGMSLIRSCVFVCFQGHFCGSDSVSGALLCLKQEVLCYVVCLGVS